MALEAKLFKAATMTDIPMTPSKKNNWIRISFLAYNICNVLNDIGNGFRVYRELEIMRHCNHENILSLYNVSVDPDTTNFNDL